MHKMPSGLKIALKTSILLLVIGFSIFRSLMGTTLDSFANDEPYHILSGVHYIQESDFRLNPEHPPLAKLWIGFWNRNMQLRPIGELNDKYHERHLLQEILYYDNDPTRVQKITRFSMYTFHALLGLCLALLLWKIFGFSWAVISMLFLAVEPTVSAHQPLALTDLPLSMTLVITALAGAKLCTSWSWKWAVIFGVSFGLCMASKHSALPGLLCISLLCLMFSILPIFSGKVMEFAQKFSKLFLAATIAIITLWACYGFQNHSSKDGQDHFNRTLEQKIDDLNLDHWKKTIRFLEKYRILPRSYIWGLADTVRAGIEGRGDDQHLFFGKVVEGRAPYLYFPGTMLMKIPIPLLLLFIAGIAYLTWQIQGKRKGKNSSISYKQWVAILFLIGIELAHLMALASGRTSYGGIRHALPAVFPIAVISGAGVLWIYRKINWGLILSIGILVLTFLLTIREKRLWEYFNEFAGGSEQGYTCFCDEGVYLGQRFYEVKEYFDSIKTDQKIYRWAWFMEEEWKAGGLPYTRMVKDIHDDNHEGRFPGYYVFHVCDFLKWPNWDPENIKKLEKVKRVGNIQISRGEMVEPKSWASSMSGLILDYVRENKDPDWELVAKKLEEVTQIIDFHTTPYIILGNAYLKMGLKEKALEAYTTAKGTLDPADVYKNNLEKHIENVNQAADVKILEPLRPAIVE